MKHLLRSWPTAILLALALASCKDDPALVEKRDKQRAEVIKLKRELVTLEERVKNMPPDVSEDLAAAKEVEAKNNAEVKALETEVAALEAKRRSLQEEFDAYRIRYQAK